MDKEILKLFPQKAFKLLSFKDSLRIGGLVTKSLLVDKKTYLELLNQKKATWGHSDISIVQDFSVKKSPYTKDDGELILKIYFSQFFDSDSPVHLDLRATAFSAARPLEWIPSKLHYHFTPDFMKGVQALYKGFYLSETKEFDDGLILLGMIKESMDEPKKQDIRNLFYKHFGEGKLEPVHFSVENLQESFNAIFTFFLRKDIPLNPEFAVLGISLVTLYLTLQEIPFALNANNAFLSALRR